MNYKNIFTVLLIVAFVAAFLLAISKLSSCSSKKQETTVQTITTSVARQQAIDSIVSAAVKDSVDKLNNQMKKRDEQIRAQANRILDLKKNYTQAVSNYDADTVHTPACDSVVITSRKVITAQQQQIDTLLKQTKDSRQESATLTNLLAEKNKTLYNAYTNIATLEKQAKRTWWERNSKYFAFGAGLLVGVGTAAFITK
ncbi:MAG: hypothetical protein P4L28_12085 [Paludibacteraceae bacterium]|nr:hypothetical protein [Paludibacteraceae bacterium]